MAERCNRCGYTVANVNCPDCAPVYGQARTKAPPSLPGRDELNDWFLSLPDARQKALLDGDRWMLAGAAFLAGQQSAITPESATQVKAPSGQQAEPTDLMELAKRCGAYVNGTNPGSTITFRPDELRAFLALAGQQSQSAEGEGA